jgi:hypothetical protein
MVSTPMLGRHVTLLRGVADLSDKQVDVRFMRPRLIASRSETCRSLFLRGLSQTRQACYSLRFDGTITISYTMRDTLPRNGL